MDLSFVMPLIQMILVLKTIVQPPEPEDLDNPIMVKQWEFAYKTCYQQVQC
jgi:hypothetical protein